MIKQAFALAAVAAVLLGLMPGLASAAEGKPTVILYGSRYGATEQTARWIAEGMNGEADVLAVKEAGELGAYKFIILGSGIYYDQLHADMAAFLAARKAEIKDRVVALFVVSVSGPAGWAYLETFAQALGRKPDLVKAFGGWIKKERLYPEDTKALEEYYKSVNRPFENFDNTNKEACQEFGREILKTIQGK
jgi:menaquinone-dependent protoporphyrinogen IX oxidase